MSSFRTISTNLKDTKCLEKALKEKGFNPEVHDTPQNLYGFQNDKRNDTAEVIIRRKEVGSVSNDIGFKKQPDGTYKAIISSYDSIRYNTKWLNDLTTKYNIQQVKQRAAKEGYEVSGTSTTSDGTIVYKYRQITA